MGLLHWACQKDCAVLVRLFLMLRADPNAQDASGLTPLHHAALGQSPRVVGILLRHGARPNIVDYDCNTALNLAMAGREFGASVGSAIAERFGFDRSSLRGAVTRAGDDVVELLRHYGGVESRAPTSAEMNEIMHASAQRDMAKIKTMIAANPGIVNGRDPLGSTIHLAIYSDNMEFVELLISHGADLNAKDSTHGLTALGLVLLGHQMDMRRASGALERLPEWERNVLRNAAEREPKIARLIRKHGGW